MLRHKDLNRCAFQLLPEEFDLRQIACRITDEELECHSCGLFRLTWEMTGGQEAEEGKWPCLRPNVGVVPCRTICWTASCKAPSSTSMLSAAIKLADSRVSFQFSRCTTFF